MGLQLKAPKNMVIGAYVITILLLSGIILYWYSIITAPQPILVLNYNSMLQAVNGYMYNNLGYPVLITNYYCVTPSGHRYVFSYSNQSNRYLTDNAAITNSILFTNSNVPVVLTLANQFNSGVLANCTNWKVNYYRVT